MTRVLVMTCEGKDRLEEELDRLRSSGRADVAARLRQAFEMGTELAENAEYLAAREDQAWLERRIATLEERLQGAMIATRPARGDGVDVGVHVLIENRDTRRTEEYDIVGSGEGEPAAGRISRDSPVGSALLGHQEGDAVEIETPAGTQHVKILAVR